MDLLKDLGTRPRKSGGSYRWGLYRCPQCNKEYELVISTVNHRKRQGGAEVCRACANISIGINSWYSKQKYENIKSTFLEIFKEVHGTRYDYSKFIYCGAMVKGTIICKIHGEFLQTYADHREGHGCPLCANEENTFGLRKDVVLNKPTLIYYVYFRGLNLWKVGCTSNTLKKRFAEDKEHDLEVLYIKEYSSGYEAYAVEKWLLRYSLEYTYKGLGVIVGGNTELRTKPLVNFEFILRMANASNSIIRKINGED